MLDTRSIFRSLDLLDVRYIWDHRVHVAAGQQLHFVILRFGKEATPRPLEVEKVLKQNHVYSFSIYKLYGAWDILIKVWLDSDQPSTSLLADIAADLHGQLELDLTVREAWYEWAEPRNTDLTAQDVEDVRALASGHLTVKEVTPLLESLAERHLVHRLDPKEEFGSASQPLIKFFCTVERLSSERLHEAERAVAGAVQQHLTTAGLKSVYFGTGQVHTREKNKIIGLVEALIPVADYPQLDEYTDSMIDALGSQGQDFRTSTLLVTNNKPLETDYLGSGSFPQPT